MLPFSEDVLRALRDNQVQETYGADDLRGGSMRAAGQGPGSRGVGTGLTALRRQGCTNTGHPAAAASGATQVGRSGSPSDLCSL